MRASIMAADTSGKNAPRRRRPHRARDRGDSAAQEKLAGLLAFVEREGMVLESGRHASVPNLVDHIVGERVRGTWWGHPRGHEIYSLLSGLREAQAEVAVCKLIDGKITYIHRRLWAACARLAEAIGLERLDLIHSIHTDQGHHRSQRIPLAEWLPGEVADEAGVLGEEEARIRLAQWLGG
ncbi:MAG TPA: hypothetical protein VML55_02875 [Planctomycetaceae bacterium]|nr:hypothetical protein [Planctomycetaceae bacterium]